MELLRKFFADNRVVHALKRKVDRESEWKRKLIKRRSSRWHKYQQVANKAGTTRPKWPKFKQNGQRGMEFWRHYIKLLVQQGNPLKPIEVEMQTSLGNQLFVIFQGEYYVLPSVIQLTSCLILISKLRAKDQKPNANFVATNKPLFIFWTPVLFSLTKQIYLTSWIDLCPYSETTAKRHRYKFKYHPYLLRCAWLYRGLFLLIPLFRNSVLTLS